MSMDKNTFWQVIDSVINRVPSDDLVGIYEATRVALREFEIEDIARWATYQHYYADLADTSGLFAAASCLNDSMGNEFYDFRMWLLAQGKNVYMTALKDPDSLAALDMPANFTGFAPYAEVGLNAFEKNSMDVHLEIESNPLLLTQKADVRAEIEYFPDEVTSSNVAAHLPNMCAKYLKPGVTPVFHYYPCFEWDVPRLRNAKDNFIQALASVPRFISAEDLEELSTQFKELDLRRREQELKKQIDNAIAELSTINSSRLRENPIDINMNKDTFWQVIDNVMNKVPRDDLNGIYEATREKLCEFGQSDIAKWVNYQRYYENLADTSGLFAAACCLNDHMSDDGFTDFRMWLISQGKNVYLAALKDPDSLAELDTPANTTRFEPYGYVGMDAYDLWDMHGDIYEERENNHLSLAQKADVRADIDYFPSEVTSDNATALLPNMCAKYLKPGTPLSFHYVSHSDLPSARLDDAMQTLMQLLKSFPHSVSAEDLEQYDKFIRELDEGRLEQQQAGGPDLEQTM